MMSSLRAAGEETSVSQELLEMFLALVPDAAIVVDEDGGIVSTNEQASELFGYAHGDLLGQRIDVLVPERFRHRHRSRQEAYAKHPAARAMGAGQDLTGRRSDGSEFAVDISLAPIGLMARPLVVAAVRDATARRAATAAQARLAAIVESSLDGIVAMGTTGGVMSWNAGAERLLGYAAEEIVGSHISRLIPPEATEVFEMLLAHSLEGARVVAVDTEWQAADGRLIPIALALSPLLGPGSEQAGFSVSMRDITERKRAEAELRRQERWQAATAEIRLAVLSAESLETTLNLVCDRVCDLIDAQAAVVVITGETPVLAGASSRLSDAVGTALGPLPAPLSDAIARGVSYLALEPLEFIAQIDPTIGSITSVSVIVVGGKPAGALVASAPCDPTSTPPPGVIVDSLADQAALAIELDRARRDAERLLLAEDRDRIARDLHDVVIQRLFASGMGLQGVVSLITNERAAARVASIVDQLDATISEIRTAIFALGDRGDGRVRADVLAITRRAAEQLGFQPSVRFQGAVDNTIPIETGAHVVAVLSEALSNVVRHAQANAVQVSLAAGDEVVLVVEDDGVGIGPTDRSSGLANMRRRAERLGGSMTVDTAPGAGTRLEWRAPLSG
jgi:PAS domain S-box-containing protein